MDIQFVKIHGHDVAYRTAGSGPVLCFVHGIAGSSATWAPVMERLADQYTVIAPDLLGHGESAKPRGDYSLGAYASGVRDLLVVLGHERATFIGHSLGGGIAMQLAYQFPEMCERLVLTCSGGLGKEVNPLLRVISAPGSEYVLPVILTPRVHGIAESVGRFIGKSGLRGDPFWGEVWASYTRLTDARAQRAFVHTIRAVIDVAGQRVSARSPLSRSRSAHDDHLGRPRRRHPGLARVRRARAHARQPARDHRGRRPFPADREARPDRVAPERLPGHHRTSSHLAP